MGVNIIRTQDEKAKKVFVNWQKKTTQNDQNIYKTIFSAFILRSFIAGEMICVYLHTKKRRTSRFQSPDFRFPDLKANDIIT